MALGGHARRRLTNRGGKPGPDGETMVRIDEEGSERER